MLGAVDVSQIGIVELAVIFAAIAYVGERVLDALGLSRSSRLLRTENEDLVRRNKELDADVVHLRAEVTQLEAELSAVRVQLSELSKRDQASVLQAIEVHERQAGHRTERLVTLLTEIRDNQAKGATP